MGETIINLKLEHCCYEVIKDINQRITRAKVATAFIGGYSIFEKFFSHPAAGVVGTASTFYTVTTADWQELSDTITSLEKILRRAIAKEAGIHAVAHSFDNNRKCELFWRGVHDAFL